MRGFPGICCSASAEQLLAHCRVVLPAYGAGPYLPAIVLERPVYVREMSDGLYSPLAYLTYKVGRQPWRSLPCAALPGRG